MGFQAGDKVVHWKFGLGEVLSVEEQNLSGRLTNCYKVQIRDLTIWVPIDSNGQSSLRNPTPSDEFDSLFNILTGEAEPLAKDRFERKTQLDERMKDGRLESICCVIRDLNVLRHNKKLNDNDKSTLERAQNFLLNEWTFSRRVPRADAHQAMMQMLGG